jgi:uncharacterized protein GlcG (DUF336 family)
MNTLNEQRNTRVLISLCLLLAVATLCFSSHTMAQLDLAAQAPVINAQSCVYDAATNRLIIKGQNFQRGATVSLSTPAGTPVDASVKVKGSKKIYISDVSAAEIKDGLDVMVTNPDGSSSLRVRVFAQAVDPRLLTEDDVKRVIAQAVAQAEASGLKATIAVTDKEGNVLAVFTMQGAPGSVRVGKGTRCTPGGCVTKPPLTCGLEGVCVPSCTAAISKAVTGAFLSSQGHAFSTRTASFIVQEHFPPGVNFQGSGPLFGVQFSQFLCSDVNARSPLGLSADPGGLPLYKNGLEVGGVGIEGDGAYTLDPDPADKDVPVEELVAVAATRGFEAPSQITGDKIIVNGIRFPYVNAQMPPEAAITAFDKLRGTLEGTICSDLGLSPKTVLPAQPSKFRVITLDPSIPAGRVDDRFFPFKAGTGLSKTDVQQIIVQAARQAFITRAAIRQPENSAAEVNITVVDRNGNILGIFSTIDAPIFGFDVSAQKARTAAFFSNSTAGAQLRKAGFGNYVDAASADGVRLDGTVAFSDRAQGFLSRPFFPDGIDDTEHGPFSKPIEDFSPFNDGLQLDLVGDTYFGNILRALMGNGAALTDALTPPCPSISAIANGIQIFPGSVPLYKGGQLVGAIGISGDGVDQDDIIASMGSEGFDAPLEIRSDRVFVRGVRLPYTKFPRHPNR